MNKKNFFAGATLALSAAILSPACGDDGPASGSGTISFSSWGEEYIEDQIPAADFEDGYSVSYSKFLVLVGNITVADSDGTVAASDENFYLIDHTEPGVKPVVAFEGLAAQAYPLVNYETSPSERGKIKLIGAASEADADLMAEQGYHVYVEGTLSKGGESKTFAWGFGVPTLLDDCEGELDGKLTAGAVVTEGGNDSIELTIHGDHFFYDDLQAADAVVRGEAVFAADADMDGEVTLAELAEVRLVDLPADQYGTGGVDGVNDLGAFIEFLSRTVGHYRGEGECFLTSPE
jgi:hypothetical protein